MSGPTGGGTRAPVTPSPPDRVPIAEASALLQMHPQTLRKYERAGLLQPARRSGGSRRYSAIDLDRLTLIKQLADVRRINVAGIALALSIRDEVVLLMERLDSADARSRGKLATEGLALLLGLVDDPELE